MLNLSPNLISYFRACAVCGNSWGKIDWLCENCEKEFLERIQFKTQFFGNVLKHQYLIEWKSEDSFVDALVYSLKGVGLIKTYGKLAPLFLNYKMESSPDMIFYASKGIKDHGYQWAKVFGEIFSCPIYGLKAQGVKKQSLLSREERSERRFEPFLEKTKNPYFVDDIVTSGATVRAAYKALSQPGKLTIWSLFYRRNL